MSAEDDECSGQPSTSKTTENVEKIQELVRTDCRQTCIHQWDKVWSLAGDLTRKYEHVPHYHKVCFPTLDRWSGFVTNNNMVIVPHPPYLLNLAPCDITLFPKLKMLLKG
jgi:hypothetical protein